MSDSAWILIVVLVAVPVAWFFLELRDRGNIESGDEVGLDVEVGFFDDGGGGDGGGGDGGGGGD